jgi:hypothetical protein
LTRYGDGGWTCSYVIYFTESAYVLTLGDGLTSITANGQDFVVDIFGGDDSSYYSGYSYGYSGYSYGYSGYSYGYSGYDYSGYDYSGYDYSGYDYSGYDYSGYYSYGYSYNYRSYYYSGSGSGSEQVTAWENRAAMEASDLYRYLTGTAELELTEVIHDMEGEVWDYVEINTFPNDFIYFQMTGVDEDGEC